jgi:hypothetical protein
MRKVVKLSMGTAVIAVIVGASFTLISLGLFLQTLYALTREIPVAEVVMRPIQTDDLGSYIEIEFTPYVYPNALEQGLQLKQVGTAGTPQRGTPEVYKVYGDTVAIRGPFVKLHPALLILNFSNTYKLSLIEGEYRLPGTPTTLSEGTEIPINGGFDPSWWDFNSREATFPYNLLVDRFTISGDEEPGFYGTGKKRYEIVATMDTLTWNFIEDVTG